MKILYSVLTLVAIVLCARVAEAQCTSPTINGTEPTCTQTSYTFTTEAGMSAYNWIASGGSILTGNGTNTITVEWVTTTNTSVAVVYTKPGCSPAGTQRNVTLLPAPTATITPINTAYCVGVPVTFSTAAGKSNYTWSYPSAAPAAHPASLPTGQGTSDLTVTWAASSSPALGRVVVRYLDNTQNGCYSFGEKYFNVHTQPIVTITGPASVCLPGGNGQSTYTATSGFAIYNWTITGGTIASQSGSSVTVNWSSTGGKTISLSATGSGNPCGGASASLQVNVGSPPTIVPVVSGSTATTCPGTTVTYSATGSYPSYTWIFPDGTPTTSVTGSSIGIKWNNGGPKGIAAIGNDAIGCPSPSSAALITTVNGPAITGSGETCIGTAASYSITSGLTGVTWSVTNGIVTGSGNNVTINFTVAGEQTITVSGTGVSNGCTVTAPISKRVYVMAQPTGSISSSAACFGTPTNLNVQLNSLGVTSATWSVTNGNSVVSQPGGSGVITWNNTGSATISVTNVVSTFGCTVAPISSISRTPSSPPAVPTLTPGGPIQLCPEGNGTSSVVLTSSTGAGLNYSWLKDDVYHAWTGTSNTLTVNSSTPSASYKVRIQNAAGCSAVSAPVSVAVNSIPTLTLTAAGPTTFCSPGSVVLNVTGAPGPFVWYDQNNQVISGVTGSSYTATTTNGFFATYTNSAGCTGVSNGVAVYANETPTVTLSSSSLYSCSGTNITLSTNQQAPLEWRRNGTLISGQTGASYITNVAGTYTATKIISSTGCTGTSSPITIGTSTTPSLTISASGAPTTFCTGGSVTLTATGGVSGSYVWTKDLVPVSGQSGSTLVATTSGNYRVNYTNPQGCSAGTGQIYVNVLALPPVNLSAGGATSFCPGGSVVLTASGGTGSPPVYVWKKDNVVISGASAATYTANAAGNYTASWTNSSSCTGTSAAINVSLNATPPTITMTNGGPTTFCAGGSVVFTAGGGVAGNYRWRKNAADIPGATGGTYTVDTPGLYSVAYTNGQNCTGYSPAVTVTVNALPTITTSAGGPTTFCTGGNVVLTASGGSTPYIWKKDNVLISGASSATYTANAAGNYTASWTNSNSCTGTSAPISVTINSIPTISISAGGPTTFCQGGSVTLTASGGSGSYTWMRNGSPIGGTTATQSATIAGNYTVSSVVNGCTGTSSALGVTVNPLPSLSVSAGGPTSFCAGGSVTLTASGGSAPYTWLLNGSVMGGATASTYAASSTGAYSVTWTNGNGCSSSSSAVTVSVNPLPTISITQTGPTTLCEGSPSYLSTPANGDTFNWYRDGAWISNSNSIAITQSGNYHLVQQTPQGCSATSSTYSYTVNPTPTISISPNNPSVCEGGYVAITANTVAGATVHWYTSSGQWVATGGQLVFSSAVTGNGGSYYAISNLNGCASTSNTSTLTVTPKTTTPTINRVNQCGTAILSSSLSANYYEWKNGATIVGTGSSYTATALGTYTLQTLNNGSCWSDVVSYAVTVLPTPNVTASRTGVLCPTGQVTLSALARNGTVVSYDWSHGHSGASVPAYAAGTYTVTVTFVGGCTATSSVSVPAPPANCAWLLRTAPEEQKPVSNSDASPIVEEPTISTTHISPNPASTEINIQTSPANYPRKVSLVNMQGVTILNSELAAGSSNARVLLNGMTQGMYLVIIQSSDKTERHKIIVQQ